jgi:hypothetical protein
MAPRIPVQGVPGKFDGRNPTLLPNFDQTVFTGSAISLENPGTFAQNNPRSPAEVTATVGGTVAMGDELTLVLSNPIFGGAYFGNLSPAQISATYTVLAGDTPTTIAEAFADLFNDSTNANEADIRVDVTGSVMTFRHAGPIGNFSTLTADLGEPSKITVGGTALTGDQLNVLVAGTALGPVLPATAEAEFAGGTYNAGDTVSLTFTNALVSAFPITSSYTVKAGDTPITVAAALAAVISANVSWPVEAIATGNVIDLSHQGAIGNSTVVSAAITGTGTETVTFLPANGRMIGGSGQPGGVLVQTSPTTLQSPSTMATNLAAAINANADLSALGIAASAVSTAVNLTVPASAEPLTITAWVNTIAPAATITGAVAAGDVLNLIFTAAYLPGGSHTVSHTALIGETTTTLATNLANAINADGVMIEAGITASGTANVVDAFYYAASGQIRFSASVSIGAETVTWTATPTETLTVTSLATEVFTIANGGVFTGGAGPVYAVGNFSWAQSGGPIEDFQYGKGYVLSYDYLSALVNQGQPIL